MSELIKLAISLIPIVILTFLIIYFLYSLSIYFFVKKMKLSKSNEILSFIPILQTIPYLKVIRVDTWKLLFLLIPIVNIIVLLTWEIKTLKQFKANPIFVILLFIPIVNVLYILIRLYIAASKKHQSKIKLKDGKNLSKKPEINTYYDIYGNKKTFDKCYVDDVILDEYFEEEYKKHKKNKK